MAFNADQVLFAHVVDRPEDELQLDVAALLLGDWARAAFDVSHYLTLLDRFAEQVLRELERREPAPFVGIRALNHVVFERLGFRGNEDDYYDPRNSFLHEVIDRRVGIPISLSVVYMEIGRRAGLDIAGVAFPGHFLTRYDEDDESLIIDPFHLGMSLDEQELRRRLARVGGRDAELTAEMFAPATKRQVLRRMLANLASIYRNQGDLRGSIAVLERIQVLAPDDASVSSQLAALRRRAGTLN